MCLLYVMPPFMLVVLMQIQKAVPFLKIPDPLNVQVTMHVGISLKPKANACHSISLVVEETKTTSTPWRNVKNIVQRKLVRAFDGRSMLYSRLLE